MQPTNTAETVGQNEPAKNSFGRWSNLPIGVKAVAELTRMSSDLYGQVARFTY